MLQQVLVELSGVLTREGPLLEFEQVNSPEGVGGLLVAGEPEVEGEVQVPGRTLLEDQGQRPEEPAIERASDEAARQQEGPVRDDDVASLDTWPQFRGHGARGIARDQDLPLQFSVAKGRNLHWNTPIYHEDVWAARDMSARLAAEGHSEDEISAADSTTATSK